MLTQNRVRDPITLAIKKIFDYLLDFYTYFLIYLKKTLMVLDSKDKLPIVAPV